MDCCSLILILFHEIYVILIALSVIIISPFSAFAQMLGKIFHVDPIVQKTNKKVWWRIFSRTVPQFIFVIWTTFSASVPLLFTAWIIPSYVKTLQDKPLSAVTIIVLSTFFFISIFCPVFLTLRAGWDWKIIETRYHYRQKLNFHVLQKIQQILGPMESVSELNWHGTYEQISLIEDIHIAIYGNEPEPALTFENACQPINSRSDIDDNTKQNICNLIHEMRHGDPDVARHATSLKLKLSFSNFLALSHIVIEFFQLMAISMMYNQVLWPFKQIDILPSEFNTFGISVLFFENSLLNLITFWLVILLIVIWLIITIPFHWANIREIFFPEAERHSRKMERKAPQRNISDEENENENGENKEYINPDQYWYESAREVTRTPFRQNLLFITSDLSFFVVIVKLCGFLSCDYSAKPPTMTQMPEEQCFEGAVAVSHSVIAMFGLLYYVMTSFCYTSMQFEVRSEMVKGCEIQFDYQFTGLEKIIKLASACALALFQTFEYIPQIVSFFCASALLCLLVRQSSCTVFILDFIRPTALCMVVYSSIYSLTAIFTENSHNTSYVVGFIVGFVLIFLFALIKWLIVMKRIKKIISQNSVKTNNSPLLESLINSN
eukprot:c11342_g1_i1.p1 GENE.c11342_g1_i1~~c11342_g1_i1.p1  ORF type:complete len:621 (+),score=175.55 c11342_g1_i1:45-1865(+)